MIIKTQFSEFIIHFRYRPGGLMDRPPFKYGQTTECVVHSTPCERLDGECVSLKNPSYGMHGEARCNPTDVFSKAVGRKVALLRALDKLPRYARKAIIDGYFLQSPPPKRNGQRANTKYIPAKSKAAGA